MKKKVVTYANRRPELTSCQAYISGAQVGCNRKVPNYLYGGKFMAFIDNNTLTYIFTTAKLEATEQRWVAALFSYDFSFKCRTGQIIYISVIYIRLNKRTNVRFYLSYGIKITLKSHVFA